MTNEQIDRGLKVCDEIIGGVFQCELRQVLEAMKETNGICTCQDKYPGASIMVKDIKSMKCYRCGKDVVLRKDTPNTAYPTVSVGNQHFVVEVKLTEVHK